MEKLTSHRFLPTHYFRLETRKTKNTDSQLSNQNTLVGDPIRNLYSVLPITYLNRRCEIDLISTHYDSINTQKLIIGRYK